MLTKIFAYLEYSQNGNFLKDVCYVNLANNEKIELIYKLAFILQNGTLKREKSFSESIIYEICNDNDQTISQYFIQQFCNISVNVNFLKNLTMIDTEVAKELILKFKSLNDLDAIYICKQDKNEEIIAKTLVLRSNISSMICDYVVSVCDISTIRQLVFNKNAQISVNTYCELIQRFAKDSFTLNYIIKILQQKKLLDSVIKSLEYESKRHILIKLLQINSEDVFNFATKQKIYGFKFLANYKLKISLINNIDTRFRNGQLDELDMLKYLCKGDVYSFAYSVSKHLEIRLKVIKNILTQNYYSVDYEELLKRANFSAKAIKISRLILQIIYEACTQGYVTDKKLANIIKDKVTEIDDNYKATTSSHILKIIKQIES